MAISTTTTKKNRIYSLNNYQISLGKMTSINHEIIGHIDKGFKALLVDSYCVRASMNTNKESSKRIKKINNDTKLILTVVLVFLSGIQGVFLSSSSSSSSYLGSQVLALQEQNNNDNEKDQNNNELSLSSLIKQGSPHLGDLSAPITIIDFSDFRSYLSAR